MFTIIDPRKPLPEAVNVKFQSGDIRRVRVSSLWIPPICSLFKEIGHSVKRCKSAPISCSGCNSSMLMRESCPRVGKKKKHLDYRVKPVVEAPEPVSPKSIAEVVPKVFSGNQLSERLKGKGHL